MTWFGFLDYLPFVGTVKNISEGVIALINGDTDRFYEKFTFVLVGAALDVLTWGTAIPLFSLGVLAEKGVQIPVKMGGQSTIAWALGILIIGGGVTYKKYRIKYKTRGNECRRPSRKGEHVINNDVLKVYRKIVSTFVKKVLDDELDEMTISGRLSEDSLVVRRTENPIRKDGVANFIQHEMKVYVDGQPYLETNSESYGQKIKDLRIAVVAQMRAVYEHIHDGNDDHRQGLEENIGHTVINDFLAGNYFVDKHALHLWQREKTGNKEKFEEARDEVIYMFQELEYRGNDCMLTTWVKELSEAHLLKGQ